jgi:hypothetical protein
MNMPDLDLESFRQEFESSYEEPEQAEEEVVEEEPETVEEEPETVEEQPEETPEQEEEQPEEEEEPQQPRKQSRAESQAFAEMRKQNEALKRQAALVEKAAARAGMTVDQYLVAVEEQEAQERAEKQGIPVEVLRRLENSENQLNQITIQAAQEKYLADVKMTQQKLGFTDQEAEAVFKFLGENGYVNPQTRTPIIPFEQAYKLANFDTLMERKLKEDNQKRLAEKQQRQKNTALPHTNAGATSNPTVEEEITDDFVMKRLKERGHIF